MILGIFATIISTVITFVVSVLLLFSKPRSKEKLYFALFTFQVFLWNVVHVVGFSTNEAIVKVAVSLSLLVVAFLPFTFLLFSHSFVEKQMSRKKMQTLATIPVIICILSFTEHNISGFNGAILYENAILGDAYVLYAFYFIVYFVYSLQLIFSFFHVTEKLVKKIQAFIIFIAVTISASIAIINNVLLPVVANIYTESTIGTSVSLVFILLTAFLLIRYRYLSVHIKFPIILFISIILFLYTILSFFVLYIVWVVYESLLFTVCISMIGLLGMIAIKSSGNVLLNKISFFGFIDLSKKFQHIKDDQKHERILSSAINLFVDNVEELVDVSVSSVYIYKPHQNIFQLYYTGLNKSKLFLKGDISIDTNIYSIGGGSVKKDRILKKNGANTILSIVNKDIIVALIFINVDDSTGTLKSDFSNQIISQQDNIVEAIQYYNSAESARKTFSEMYY